MSTAPRCEICGQAHSRVSHADTVEQWTVNAWRRRPSAESEPDDPNIIDSTATLVMPMLPGPKAKP